MVFKFIPQMLLILSLSLLFDCAQIKMYMAVFIGSCTDIMDAGEKSNEIQQW